jgi:hypothetical protein
MITVYNGSATGALGQVFSLNQVPGEKARGERYRLLERRETSVERHLDISCLQ